MTRADLNRVARTWSKTLDYANEPGRDAKDGAVAIALWATINVDRLILAAGDSAK